MSSASSTGGSSTSYGSRQPSNSRSTSSIFEKGGIRRYSSSAPFENPYYATARVPDRHHHESRLKEEIRRIEDVFRS